MNNLKQVNRAGLAPANPTSSQPTAGGPGRGAPYGGARWDRGGDLVRGKLFGYMVLTFNRETQVAVDLDMLLGVNLVPYKGLQINRDTWKMPVFYG